MNIYVSPSKKSVLFFLGTQYLQLFLNIFNQEFWHFFDYKHRRYGLPQYRILSMRYTDFISPVIGRVQIILPGPDQVNRLRCLLFWFLKKAGANTFSRTIGEDEDPPLRCSCGGLLVEAEGGREGIYVCDKNPSHRIALHRRTLETMRELLPRFQEWVGSPLGQPTFEAYTCPTCGEKRLERFQDGLKCFDCGEPCTEPTK